MYLLPIKFEVKHILLEFKVMRNSMVHVDLRRFKIITPIYYIGNNNITKNVMTNNKRNILIKLKTF